MVLSSKPEREPKPTNVKEHEQCESRVCASNLPIVRCGKRGLLYRVNGKLANGFARFCDHHRVVFERQGYTLELLTPIELVGQAKAKG